MRQRRQSALQSTQRAHNSAEAARPSEFIILLIKCSEICHVDWLMASINFGGYLKPVWEY